MVLGIREGPMKVAFEVAGGNAHREPVGGARATGERRVLWVLGAGWERQRAGCWGFPSLCKTSCKRICSSLNPQAGSHRGPFRRAQGLYLNLPASADTALILLSVFSLADFPCSPQSYCTGAVTVRAALELRLGCQSHACQAMAVALTVINVCFLQEMPVLKPPLLWGVLRGRRLCCPGDGGLQCADLAVAPLTRTS